VTQESLRRAISLVPQEPILFHRSLRDNIRYGRPHASDAEVIAAAAQSPRPRVHRAPGDGYDTLVGERGIKLSGGERQRVAIARAILADAPILVLDEATSSLDSITEHYIQEAIATLMQAAPPFSSPTGCPRCASATASWCSIAAEIVEQGTHDELMAPPGRHLSRAVRHAVAGLRRHGGRVTGFVRPAAVSPPGRYVPRCRRS
jgi:ATP-binding cassette, subfamily B, bacterial